MSSEPNANAQPLGPAPRAGAVAPAGTDAPLDGGSASRTATAASGNAATEAPAPGPGVRDELLNAGWAQGRVLPADLLGAVQRIPFAPPPTDNELAIVIMTDCDTIQGDCVVEPAVEVVVARRIETVQNNLKALKNPRLLHVEAVDVSGKPQPIEVGVWSRGYIDRRLLASREPSAEWTVPEDAIGLIVDLFSRRYDRSTFPDCFMRRFAGVAEKFDRIVTRRGEDITGIFLRVDPPDAERPDDEDPNERPYEVRIYLTMSKALCADMKRRAQWESEIRKDLIAAMRSTPGITAGPVNLIDPLLITLGEWMEATEWDHEPLRAGIAAKSAARRGAGGPPRGGAAADGGGGRPIGGFADDSRPPASPLD